MSNRSVHPQEDAVLAAMEKLGGHKTGHMAAEGLIGQANEKALNA
jgi:hypothetical protein